MARKPIPTHLKVIAGTDRPDRRPEGAIAFSPLEVFPEPPTELNTDGVEMWITLGPQLMEVGILQAVDVFPFQQLCYCWQRYRAKMKANLEITSAETVALKGLFSEFGMSWASRRKMPGLGIPSNRFKNNGKKK